MIWYQDLKGEQERGNDPMIAILTSITKDLLITDYSILHHAPELDFESLEHVPIHNYFFYQWKNPDYGNRNYFEKDLIFVSERHPGNCNKPGVMSYYVITEGFDKNRFF